MNGTPLSAARVVGQASLLGFEALLSGGKLAADSARRLAAVAGRFMAYSLLGALLLLGLFGLGVATGTAWLALVAFITLGVMGAIYSLFLAALVGIADNVLPDAVKVSGLTRTGGRIIECVVLASFSVALVFRLVPEGSWGLGLTLVGLWGFTYLMEGRGPNPGWLRAKALVLLGTPLLLAMVDQKAQEIAPSSMQTLKRGLTTMDGTVSGWLDDTLRAPRRVDVETLQQFDAIPFYDQDGKPRHWIYRSENGVCEVYDRGGRRPQTNDLLVAPTRALVDACKKALQNKQASDAPAPRRIAVDSLDAYDALTFFGPRGEPRLWVYRPPAGPCELYDNAGYHAYQRVELAPMSVSLRDRCRSSLVTAQRERMEKSAAENQRLEQEAAERQREEQEAADHQRMAQEVAERQPPPGQVADHQEPAQELSVPAAAGSPASDPSLYRSLPPNAGGIGLAVTHNNLPYLRATLIRMLDDRPTRVALYSDYFQKPFYTEAYFGAALKGDARKLRETGGLDQVQGALMVHLHRQGCAVTGAYGQRPIHQCEIGADYTLFDREGGVVEQKKLLFPGRGNPEQAAVDDALRHIAQVLRQVSEKIDGDDRNGWPSTVLQ